MEARCAVGVVVPGGLIQAEAAHDVVLCVWLFELEHNDPENYLTLRVPNAVPAGLQVDGVIREVAAVIALQPDILGRLGVAVLKEDELVGPHHIRLWECAASRALR